MSRKVTLVIPEAPVPASGAVVEQRKLARGGLRLGGLDNGKGNADHLLEFVVEGLKALTPVASVVSMRKGNVAMGASKEILDRLGAEADFVVSAMAD